MEYKNTKLNNEHYKGKVWVTKGEMVGKNICVEMANGELKVIAFVPRITQEAVENAIMAMGWRLEDWIA